MEGLEQAQNSILNLGVDPCTLWFHLLAQVGV